MAKPIYKVHNLHEKEFKIKIDEKDYVIPGHGCFETVHRDEARKLVGAFVPPKYDGVGNPLNPKMLKLEYPKDHEGNEMRYKKQSEDNRSMLDGKSYPSAEALKAHILANAHKTIDPEAVVKAAKRS